VKLETITDIGYKKIWGEHSLTIGEILGVAIGVAIIILNPFGKWSLWLGLIVIGISMAIF